MACKPMELLLEACPEVSCARILHATWKPAPVLDLQQGHAYMPLLPHDQLPSMRDVPQEAAASNSREGCGHTAVLRLWAKQSCPQLCRVQTC